MAGLGFKQIALIIGFFLLLASIPVTLILLKKTQIFQSKAYEAPIIELPPISSASGKLKPTPKLNEVPSSSPLTELQKLMAQNSTLSATPTPATESGTPTPTPNLTFGPTLSLKVSLEGRPTNNQSAMVFIGLAAGEPNQSPTYLLSYTVDFPADGLYRGLSLAGLSGGSTYTAYIKGPAQITSAQSFAVGIAETYLNGGNSISLTTGDLNDDNTINTADYSIAKASLGAKSGDSTWNSRIDFNLDGVINTIDLGYITKNFGKTGLSGVWYSPPPISTQSAILTKPNIGSVSGDGYWLWLPK